MRVTRLDIAISCALVVGTLGIYWHGLENHFVDYDDGLHVVDNEYVRNGLTWTDVRWAFSTCKTGIWHPLTWLSLQLDSQVYGPRPWGFHFTNLWLHCANSLLLFAALRAMTGDSWPAALTAALFAWHPLHVESVAWISERKDVLSAFFWMLTLLAYWHYARKPSFVRYVVVLTALILGLMAKPMLVTMPFVLLLLDYWPLGRLKSEAGAAPETRRRGQPVPAIALPADRVSSLILEKTPLFLASAATSVLAWYAQQSVGAIQGLEKFSLPVRLQNAAAAYAGYLLRTLAPTDLAVYYPHPAAEVAAGHWLSEAAVLLVITAAAVRYRRLAPYLFVGWFWFVGTLVPVIGIVQIGDQASADRYTYIPLIGIFLAVSWGSRALLARSAPLRSVAAPVVAVVLLYFLCLTWYQVGFWHDSQALWMHAIEVTKDNVVAYHNLGCVYARSGKHEDARKLFRVAIDLDPNYALARTNLGYLLASDKKYAEAIEHFEKAVALQPESVAALQGLGGALTELGRQEEAVAILTKMFLLQAAQVAASGKFEEAASLLRTALKMTNAAQRLDLSAQIESRLRAYESHRLPDT